MGRWAQRQIRGGGGSITTRSRIVSVVTDATETVVVHFADPVTLIDTPAVGEFTAGGQDPIGAVQITPTTVTIDMTGVVDVANPWAATAGNWVNPPVSPGSGFCS